MAHVVLPHDWLTCTADRRRAGDRSRRRVGHRLLVAGDRRVPLGPARRSSTPIATGRPWCHAVLGPARGRRHVGGARSRPAPATTWPPRSASALQPGDAVVSLGTSGTVVRRVDRRVRRPDRAVAGFADATGRFLPLVCTLNATKVTDAVRRSARASITAEFDRLALAAPWRRWADAAAVLRRRAHARTCPTPPACSPGCAATCSREQLARAAVEGVVCGLLDGARCVAAHCGGRRGRADRRRRPLRRPSARCSPDCATVPVVVDRRRRGRGHRCLRAGGGGR